MNLTRTAWRRWTATVVPLCLLAVACSSTDNGSDGASATDGTAATAEPASDTAANATDAPADTAAATTGSFSVAISEPGAIDPALAGEVEGFQVMRLLFTPLVSLGPDLELEPGVATEWSVADDEVTWTFELRPEATFSTGRPVVADDFVYAFARAADPDMAAPAAYQGSPIVGWDDVNGGEASGEIADVPVSGVTAIDADTLQIVTTEPFSLLPQLLTYPLFAPVPSEVLATEEGAAAFAEQPIGNGPYQLAEPWQHQESITMVRNPEWVGDAGEASQIDFRIYADLATAFKDFQAGKVDLLRTVPPEQMGAVDQYGDRVVRQPQASLIYIGLPNQRAPFDQVDLRRALSLAIDREAINQSVFAGTQTPADAMVPSATPGALSGSCDSCRYDPELAKELYDAAGGVPGNRLVMLDIADDGSDMLEAIINGWRDVLGLEVVLESHPFAEFLDLTADASMVEGPFELGWVWDYPSGHSFLSPLFESTSAANNLGYSNPEFDATMEAVRRSTDEASAFSALQEGQRIVERDMPLIPLGFNTEVGVHSERISEVRGNLGGAWQLEDVVVEG